MLMENITTVKLKLVSVKLGSASIMIKVRQSMEWRSVQDKGLGQNMVHKYRKEKKNTQISKYMDKILSP